METQHATVVQLAQEGIQSVDDLANFDKDALQQFNRILPKSQILVSCRHMTC